MERLEKRMDRHVGELVARHIMEQTRVDGIEQGLSRIERALEMMGAKVDESDGDEEETLKDADGEAGKGKGKAKEADDGESGDESEERTEDE